MVATAIVLPIGALVAVGGVGELITGMSTAGATSVVSITGPGTVGFVVGTLGIGLGYPGQPHVLVRFMALAKPAHARIGGIISAVWATAVYWGAVTVGLMVRTMTETDTASGDTTWTATLGSGLAEGVSDVGDTGLVLAANNMIPGMMSGLVLAAVLAAICSTADSQLVVAASAAANDIYVRLIERTGKLAHLLINRVVMVGLGIGAVLLVIDERIEIYKYVLDYGWAILGAAFGPQLILLLTWKRASYAGCVAGMGTGFVTALLWKVLGIQEHIKDEYGVDVYNLTLAFAAAMVVNIVVSLCSRPRETA